MGEGGQGGEKNWHLLNPSKFKGLSHVSLTPFIFPKTYQLNNHLSNFKTDIREVKQRARKCTAQNSRVRSGSQVTLVKDQTFPLYPGPLTPLNL